MGKFVNDPKMGAAGNKAAASGWAAELVAEANSGMSLDSSASVKDGISNASQAAFMRLYSNSEAQNFNEDQNAIAAVSLSNERFQNWQSEFQVKFVDVAINTANKQGLSIEGMAEKLEGASGDKLFEQYENRLKEKGVDLDQSSTAPKMG